jgi:hypothetical protein
MQLNGRIKILHSDRGGKYLGKAFVLYLKSKGTAQKLTVHDTPQHNGVAEHCNRTIVEQVRTLLHASGLLRFLWCEAARHVVWLMNRTLTKAVSGQTPYKATFGSKPDLQHVCKWGEKVWVRTETGNKLGGRVTEGHWMGIDDQSRGFRIYWPEKRSVTVEWNVYFDTSIVSASRLEGEEWQFIEMTTNAPSSTVHKPTVTSAPPVLDPQPTADTSDQSDSKTKAPVKRVQKPSQCIRDILDGHGTSTHHSSDPAITPGVQLPTVIKKTTEIPEGEGTADWIMLAENIEEYALVAEKVRSKQSSPAL